MSARATVADPVVLTATEAARALGISAAELEHARVNGEAPAHLDLGKRTVRYFRTAVLEAVNAR